MNLVIDASSLDVINGEDDSFEASDLFERLHT
jgi:hypothetical protein